MRFRFIEATNNELNWGKFAILEFDHEDMDYVSPVSNTPLLGERRWKRNKRWLLDLETCEGIAAEMPAPGKAADVLSKHRVWVCPMYEPLLDVVLAQDDPFSLPPLVNLPNAPFNILGYRRRGPASTSPRLFYTPDLIVLCGDHAAAAFKTMVPPYIKAAEGTGVKDFLVEADQVSRVLLRLQCAMCGRVPIFGRTCKACKTPLHPQWGAEVCSYGCGLEKRSAAPGR